MKKDDHAADALRYAVMSRPEEPKLEDFKGRASQQNTLSGSVRRELEQLKTGGATKDPWAEVYGKDVSWDDSY